MYWDGVRSIDSFRKRFTLCQRYHMLKYYAVESPDHIGDAAAIRSQDHHGK